MNKTLIILASLFIGLGTIQSTEAQLLGKLKKKAEKKVERAVDGKPNSKKSVSKKPSVSSPTASKSSTDNSNSTNRTRPTSKSTAKPKSAQPPWVDTTRVRNAFWKAEIAQKLLKVTDVEAFKGSFPWMTAKNFTDAYVPVQKIFDKGERPVSSAKVIEQIDVLLNPRDFDKHLSSYNDKMGGAFSTTPFWKETSKTLHLWKEKAAKWKDTPAIHFDQENVPFNTSVEYLKSVVIANRSDEGGLYLNLNVVSLDEPKVMGFDTSFDINRTEYGDKSYLIKARDDGYFLVIYESNHRFVFGPEATKAKEIEATLEPLFPEKVLEGCVVCEAHSGNIGKIYFATQGEPLKEKGEDFYSNDPAWDGVGRFYSRIVLGQSLNNAISKSNPWKKGNIKYRWYVKGEKENVYVDPLPRSDEGGEVANDLTWWQEMYEGVDVQDVPTKTFKQIHHVLMDKGPGSYTLVGELVMREGDSETGYTETILAQGEKAVNLSEANYKRLFVGPKKGISAYRPPAYHSAASASIKAAAKRHDPNVKAVYMTSNNKWYWVVNSLGVKLHQQNDGVVLIYSRNGKSHFSFATAKKDNGAYSVKKDALSQRTSKRNYSIK